MTVYCHNVSATQFDIFQRTGGSLSPWIKSRIYRYSTSPGDQWGWNGTRSCYVGKLTTVAYDDPLWTFTNGGDDAWTVTAFPVNCKLNECEPGNDPAPQASITFTTTGVSDLVVTFGRATVAGIALIVLDGGFALVNGDDVNSSHQVDTYGTNGGADYHIARNVPAGEHTLVIIGLGLKNESASEYDIRIAALKIYDNKTTAVPGDTDWEYFDDKLIQSETTTDDMMISCHEGAETPGYVLGPAHGGHEVDQVVTIKIDQYEGGEDLFPDAGDDSVTVGDVCDVSISADVHAPGASASKVAEVLRSYHWEGDNLNIGTTWTKKAADLTVDYWWPSGWSCSGALPIWSRAGGLAINVAENVTTTVYFPADVTDFDVFGGDQILVKHSTDVSRAGPVCVVNGGRKTYRDGAEATLNVLDVDAFHVDVYDITFTDIGDPVAGFRPGETIYIDNAVTVDAELAAAFSHRIVKADGVAITIPAGQTVESAIFTGDTDDTRGAPVLRAAP